MLRGLVLMSRRELSRNARLGMGELGPKGLTVPAGKAAQPAARRRSAATTRVLLMRDMTISVVTFFGGSRRTADERIQRLWIGGQFSSRGSQCAGPADPARFDDA